uniref:Uncharacterized protein n=1 Tax=Arundo donax TaxID=35708 RepID=A0A0A8Y9M2_ARUDO
MLPQSGSLMLGSATMKKLTPLLLHPL